MDPLKTRQKCMQWLINDIKNALAQLGRWQTWLVIGLISLFALLAYLISDFAFKTDAILMSLRHSSGACRTMSNGVIIAMFCGMCKAARYLAQIRTLFGTVRAGILTLKRGGPKTTRPSAGVRSS